MKTPKLYFLDTGLAAYLTKWNTPDVLKNGAITGEFFESFIVSEVMMKYGEKLRFIAQSLTVKWILITCMVVLPINILTVILTGMMNRSYQENIMTSHEGQLSIYRGLVDTEFDRMRNQAQNFMDNATLSKLIWGSADDSVVDVTRFKNSLTGSNVWCSFPGLRYVWDKEKDIISFFHQGYSYSRAFMDQLEEQLRQDLDETGSRDWIWAAIENRAFLAEFYDFPRYSFGTFIDAQWVLQYFFESAGIEEGRIYLADGDGCLLSCYSEAGFETMSEENTVEGLSAERENIVLCGSILSGSYQLVHVMDRSALMRNLPVMLTVIYVLAGISFISLPLVCVLAVRLVVKPLKRLVEGMRMLESGELEYHLDSPAGSTELDYLYGSFNHMVDELNRLVLTSYEREIEKLQTDSINMRLQVNQHMVLNFLNTIYSLSQVGKSEQIGDFTLLLMKYFRYVLQQDIALVPIREELKFVQDYLSIQKVRFPVGFTCVYSVDETAESILIPRLLLQNFVENAVKYGLILGSEIEIIINIRAENNRLFISVCDTGNGIAPEMLEKLRGGEIIEDRNGKHIGIWNCRRRMHYYYGDNCRMEITSKPGEGTQVWLEIPPVPLDSGEAARSLYQPEKEGV